MNSFISYPEMPLTLLFKPVGGINSVHIQLKSELDKYKQALMTVSGFNWQKLHAFTYPQDRPNTLEPKGFYVLKWARCLPIMGNVLAPVGQNCCKASAQ